MAVTFQIDPNILQQTLQQGSVVAQQTLQQGSVVAQQLAAEPGVASSSSSDSTGQASVLIQPISGLSLQPTVTAANLTIGPLSEQDSVLTASSSGKCLLCQQNLVPRLLRKLCFGPRPACAGSLVTQTWAPSS